MFYKNTSYMVRSPDGDTPFFDITTGVLNGDKLAYMKLYFICIICIHNILNKPVDRNLQASLLQKKKH